MKLFSGAILILIRLLNIWFFIIPGRLTVIAFVTYYLILSWIIGDQPIYLFNRSLKEKGEWSYLLFWIFFGWPLFWSFVCMFASSSTTAGTIENSTLKSVLKFRDGQMSVSTPKKAFRIFQKTALLDVIDDNVEKEQLKRAGQGFNALYGNVAPQEIYKGLMDDE